MSWWEWLLIGGGVLVLYCIIVLIPPDRWLP